MNYITHSLGGAAAGMIAISAGAVIEPSHQAGIMAGAVLGALFVDIDHRRSWAGHKLPVCAAIMSGIFKHRGPIHTPVFIVATGIILIMLNQTALQEFTPYSTYFIMGFIPGMLSHLVLDTLNVQGIMWLWPVWKKRLHLLPIRTNSMMETVVCVLMAACIYGEFRFLI